MTSYGFKLPPASKQYSISTLAKVENWDYDFQLGSYVNSDTGQIMKDYKPEGNLGYLLNNCVDKSMA